MHILHSGNGSAQNKMHTKTKKMGEQLGGSFSSGSAMPLIIGEDLMT